MSAAAQVGSREIGELADRAKGADERTRAGDEIGSLGRGHVGGGERRFEPEVAPCNAASALDVGAVEGVELGEARDRLGVDEVADGPVVRALDQEGLVFADGRRVVAGDP